MSEPDGSYSFPLLVFSCCHALLSSTLSGEFEMSDVFIRNKKSLAAAFGDFQMEDFRSGRRNSSVLSEFHRGIMRRLSETDDDIPLIRKAHERVSHFLKFEIIA